MGKQYRVDHLSAIGNGIGRLRVLQNSDMVEFTIMVPGYIDDVSNTPMQSAQLYCTPGEVATFCQAMLDAASALEPMLRKTVWMELKRQMDVIDAEVIRLKKEQLK